MKELKTLKDLEIPEHLEEKVFGHKLWKRFVGVSDLRKEAIKWAKSGNLTEIDWLMFFNISEDEL